MRRVLIFLAVTVALFGLQNTALATVACCYTGGECAEAITGQQCRNTGGTPAGQATCDPNPCGNAEMSAISVEAETITTADLGIPNPGLLPANPFYFLKEWGRGFRQLLTFNPVRKAELELRFSNEKAAELKKLDEIAPENTEAIGKALENYQETQLRLKTRFEGIKETSQNPNVDRLLDELANRTVKHEKVFDELAKKFEDQEKIQSLVKKAQEGVEEAAAAAAEKDAPAKFAAKLEKALIESRGSEFKHVRSVEIIDRLSQKASEETRQSLERLRSEFSARLSDDLKKVLDDKGAEVVRQTIQELPGDAARRAVLLEEIQAKAERRVAEALEGVSDILEKAAREEKNIAEKAAEQIRRAEERILKLETKLKESEEAPAVVKNLARESQENLKESKAAFEEGKYGEAFGQARSAEVLARNGLRMLEEREEPEAEDLKKRLEELAMKIEKYAELLKSRGWTPENKPEAYKLLDNARQHLGFAGDALAKGNAAGTKLHISHVKEFLSNLSRIIEGEVRIETELRALELRSEKPAAIMPSARPQTATDASKCGRLKQNLLELDDMLKTGRLSEQDHKLKSESIRKELRLCEERLEPAPVSATPVPIAPPPSITPVKIGAEQDAICTQEYNPVCGADSKTYSNECSAKAAGMSVKYRGECEIVRKKEPPQIAPVPQEATVAVPKPVATPPAEIGSFFDVFVAIDSSGQFTPAAVKVKKGGKVTWVNKSAGAVWPASAMHPTHQLYPDFDALRGLRMGESYSFVFEKPGSWKYHNHLNPEMTGIVEVVE